MYQPARILLCVTRDPLLVASVQPALRDFGNWRIERASAVEQCRPSHDAPWDSVLLDCRTTCSPEHVQTWLRAVQEMAPDARVIACVGGGPNVAHLAFHLGRCGVDALCVAEYGGQPRDLGVALAVVDRRSRATALANELQQRIGTVSAEWLRWLLEAAMSLRTPAEVARHSGVSVRQLRAYFRAHSLRPPRQMLSWLRILLGAQLLTGARRTTESVAFELGYSSAPAFRNAYRRLAGVPPTRLRGPAGLHFLMQKVQLACLRDAPAASDLTEIESPASTLQGQRSREDGC